MKPTFKPIVPRESDKTGPSKNQGERERDYTYPALRLIQVLPGHPLADPKDETVSS